MNVQWPSPSWTVLRPTRLSQHSCFRRLWCCAASLLIRLADQMCVKHDPSALPAAVSIQMDDDNPPCLWYHPTQQSCWWVTKATSQGLSWDSSHESQKAFLSQTQVWVTIQQLCAAYGVGSFSDSPRAWTFLVYGMYYGDVRRKRTCPGCTEFAVRRSLFDWTWHTRLVEIRL